MFFPGEGVLERAYPPGTRFVRCPPGTAPDEWEVPLADVYDIDPYGDPWPCVMRVMGEHPRGVPMSLILTDGTGQKSVWESWLPSGMRELAGVDDFRGAARKTVSQALYGQAFRGIAGRLELREHLFLYSRRRTHVVYAGARFTGTERTCAG